MAIWCWLMSWNPFAEFWSLSLHLGRSTFYDCGDSSSFDYDEPKSSRLWSPASAKWLNVNMESEREIKHCIRRLDYRQQDQTDLLRNSKVANRIVGVPVPINWPSWVSSEMNQENERGGRKCRQLSVSLLETVYYILKERKQCLKELQTQYFTPRSEHILFRNLPVFDFYSSSKMVFPFKLVYKRVSSWDSLLRVKSTQGIAGRSL